MAFEFITTNFDYFVRLHHATRVRLHTIDFSEGKEQNEIAIDRLSLKLGALEEVLRIRKHLLDVTSYGDWFDLERSIKFQLAKLKFLSSLSLPVCRPIFASAEQYVLQLYLVDDDTGYDSY